MSDENEKPQWRVFGSSIQGASHVRSGLPNQDAILWKTGDNAGLPLVIAIADGHGSDRYFRSDRGAKLAVQVAVEVMLNFAKEIPDSMTNYMLIKNLAKHLPEEIVRKWKQAVEHHLSEVPFFTKQEFECFRKPEHEKEYRAVLQAIASDQTLPYGATLLTALVTSTFILYFQLGDGDIVKVMSTGESIKPVKGDARLIANETTSLCSPTAVQDFRKAMDTFDKDELPALIMLSTDGYSNSFISQDGFLKVGSDILRMLRTEGLEHVSQSVEGWLQKATHDGSGDDISLGIICALNALKAPANLPGISEARIREADVTIRRSSTEGNAGARTTPASISQLDAVVTPPGEKKQEQELVAVNAQHQPGTDASAQSANPKEEMKRSETPAVTADGRKILVVSPQPGEGNYTTISAALKDPLPTVRIEVLPGHYTEDKLFIAQDIELVAKGPRDQVMIESKSNNIPCLQIFAKHALIQGFTLRGKAGLLRKENPVIEILGGQSTLSECDITTGSNLAISIEGPTTAPVIARCDIHQSEGQGIAFLKGSGGRLEYCRIFENKKTGIVVEDRSHPTLHECDIYSGLHGGVVFSEQAGGQMEKCRIFDNAHVGIMIQDKSNPTLLQCEIKANASANIIIAQQSDPVIQGCQLLGGKEDGIVILGKSHGTVQDCTIMGHAGKGIQILDGSTPRIHGCKLYGGVGTAIWIINQAGGFIEDCVVDNHESYGIRISQKANPIIRRCQVSNSGATGIRIEEQSVGTLEDCKIEGNARYGVAVSTDSRITISGGHIIRYKDNNLHMSAVMIKTNSIARIDKCRIEDRENIGIKAQEQAKVSLRSCDVGGGLLALVVSHQSEMRLDNNSRISVRNIRNKPWVVEEGSSLYIDGKRY